MRKIILMVLVSAKGCVPAKYKRYAVECSAAMGQAGAAMRACLDKFQRDDLRIKVCDDEVARLMKEQGRKPEAGK